MTARDLYYKISVAPQGSGYYLVKIEYRGKTYSCLSQNSLAYDRMNADIVSGRQVYCEYTYKQAMEAFYDECKRKNYLK